MPTPARIASADADELAPYRRETGPGQNVGRTVAERGAVPAHIGAEAAELMLAGGIEHAGQDKEHCRHKIHRTPPCRYSSAGATTSRPRIGMNDRTRILTGG